MLFILIASFKHSILYIIAIINLKTISKIVLIKMINQHIIIFIFF